MLSSNDDEEHADETARSFISAVIGKNLKTHQGKGIFLIFSLESVGRSQDAVIQFIKADVPQKVTKCHVVITIVKLKWYWSITTN